MWPQLGKAALLSWAQETCLSLPRAATSTRVEGATQPTTAGLGLLQGKVPSLL